MVLAQAAQTGSYKNNHVRLYSTSPKTVLLAGGPDLSGFRPDVPTLRAEDLASLETSLNLFIGKMGAS